MKKLLLTFLFLSVFVELSSSQTIKFSEEIKENKNARYMRVLGSDEEGNIYVLRSNISLETDRDRSGFKSRVYFLQYFLEGHSF